MTKPEFGLIAAYIGSAIGKPLTPDALDVYFDLLGDLPAEALQLAAKCVLLEHKWATFPSIAELRQAAAKAMQAEVVEMPPAKAWEIAWRIAGADLETDGPYMMGGKTYDSAFEAQCAKHGATPRIVEAIRAYGLSSFCYGKESVSIIRAQWLKVYEQLADRDKRLALMPPKVRQAIEQTARPLPAPNRNGAVQQALGNIGRAIE